MSSEQQSRTREDSPCSLSHLQAIIEAYEHWIVDQHGKPTEFWYVDNSSGEVWQISQYYCDNCWEFFTPVIEGDKNVIAGAWQAARDHLPQPNALESAAM